MPILLAPITLAAIQSARSATPQVAGYPVASGALPPAFLLDKAQAMLEHGQKALWHAPFAFVDPARSLVVGSGGFMGAPAEGMVELGYGMADAEQGKGFASLAVAALCQLGFAEAGIVAIVADTAVGNIASRRVLEKNGFVKIGERDTEEDGLVYRWRKVRQ